jgi:hypothetical protein
MMEVVVRRRRLSKDAISLILEIIALIGGAILIVWALSGCASQELSNVANQGNYELSKIEDWGQSTVEIMEKTATALDSLDEDLAAVLSMEDTEAKREKLRTIEQKVNSIGQALFSIDISIPVVRARRAGSCFDAIIDFTGEQPEHADDDTLALHIFRLKEAQLRVEKFKTALAKVTSTISAALPVGGWLDHVWKIVLGAVTSYTGIRGLQHKVKAKKADKHNRYMVKAISDLGSNGNAQAQKVLRDQLKEVVPDKEDASFRAMVAQQLAKIREEGVTA